MTFVLAMYLYTYATICLIRIFQQKINYFKPFVSTWFCECTVVTLNICQDRFDIESIFLTEKTVKISGFVPNIKCYIKIMCIINEEVSKIATGYIATAF